MAPVLEVSVRGNRSDVGRATHAFRPAEVSPLEQKLVLSTAAVGLSPPWFTYRNEIAATVGRDPGVYVSPLVQIGNAYYVGVATNDALRGVSLATVLQRQADFGGVKVNVRVTNYAGIDYNAFIPTDANQVAALENFAFAGNPLYRGAVVKQVFFGQPTVFPVFTKSVVQFYDNNLADLYQNFNGVAANVVADIINGELADGVLIAPSTANK
jgi:hypothetical protein